MMDHSAIELQREDRVMVELHNYNKIIIIVCALLLICMQDSYLGHHMADLKFCIFGLKLL